jgi:2-methylisocitrate lyase-like PEP mutase family enzyme
VINARVDVYVRQPAASAAADPASTLAVTDDAVARANRYLAAGADCTYPILAPAAALPELVGRIEGPVNAMAGPGGLTVADLARLGIARITFGGGLLLRAARAIQEMAAALATEL